MGAGFFFSENGQILLLRVSRLNQIEEYGRMNNAEEIHN